MNGWPKDEKSANAALAQLLAGPRPALGDIVFCILTHEGAALRRQYPGITTLSVYPVRLYGITVHGRMFITERAAQHYNAPRMRKIMEINARKSGVDTTVHPLPGP